MPTDPLLLKALQNARSSNETVIDDIQARKDYSKIQDLQAAVGTLNTFNQNLMNAEAEGTLSDSTKNDLKAEAGEVNSDILADLTDKNIAMMNMYQLNQDRTIEPSVAKENNVKMAVERGHLSTLISLLQVTPKPLVKDTVLTEPKVEIANKVNLVDEESNVQTLVAEQQAADIATTQPDTASPVIDIIPETEVVSRFSQWVHSISGSDSNAD